MTPRHLLRSPSGPQHQAQVISSRPVLQRVAEGNTSPGGLWAIMTVEVAEDADVIPDPRA
jgi:hypothetical protein